jgi:hypothetical protein
VGVVAGKALSSSCSLDCDCEWFVVEEKPFLFFFSFEDVKKKLSRFCDILEDQNCGAYFISFFLLFSRLLSFPCQAASLEI